jgi:hypothetical protein
MQVIFSILKRKPLPRMYSQNPNELNFPILFFDSKREIAWTLEDAVRGTQIFGGIGSGKTSGSGKTIAKGFLQAGYGGLVLCAKKEERAAWVKYARDLGRESDLVVFSEKNPFRFNFLNYEMTRESQGGGQTLNLVKLFMTIHEMGRRQQGGGMKSEDQFWQSALSRLLFRVIELIKLSKKELTVELMYQVIATAPRDLSAFHDDTWVNESMCLQCLLAANDHAKDTDEFRLIDSFWTQEFPSLDEKTRSIICESAYALFEPFLSGLLKELLATTTNIKPEITQDGKIIILDIPVQSYLELGIYAQSIFKYVWQQAIERRNIPENPTPNFLWVDESQFFLNQHDMLFQTTARSSRTCTVLLSQNISNYYAVMGGGMRYKDMTNSLLANLSTKIFHANNDHVTNKWAADTIAQDWQMVANYSASQGNRGSSAGAGEQMVHQVRPIEFTLLKNGGMLNDLEVEAFLTIAGRPLRDGKNFMKISFDQRV